MILKGGIINFEDINLNNKDNYYLFLLFVFSIILTVHMIKFHQIRGAFNSDIYVYLAGALDFAELNFNHISDPSWLSNSPVIMFLTSLLFRLGYVNIDSIFIVTGIFGIFGIIGMYTLLKIRFSPILSFTGAILYSSLSLTLYYFANGMLDTSAVTVIIWTLIFTVAAVDKNPKYYILVSITYSIAFFTRFTSTYVISLIILYMLKKYNINVLLNNLICDFNLFKKSILSFFYGNEFKWIILSLITGIIIFITTFKFLLHYGAPISYLNMAQGSLSHYSNPYDANYVPDKLFFIKNFPSLISCNSITFNKVYVEQFNHPTFLSYVVFSIVGLGIILKCKDLFKKFKINKNFIETKNMFLIIILSISLGTISIIGFSFNYLITLICLWLIFVILIINAENYHINKTNFSFSIICFALFIFYLVIVSYMDLKCLRYLLPAFPGFIYFVVYFLEVILNFLKEYGNETFLKRFKNKRPLLKYWKIMIDLIPLCLIILCLFFTFSFTNTVEIYDGCLDRVEICDFIKEYDPDYQNEEILCIGDMRYFEWYLNKDLKTLGGDVDKIDPNTFKYIIRNDGNLEPYEDDNYSRIYQNGEYHLSELN